MSLLDAMRTIRNYLPEDKRKEFEVGCFGGTLVQYGLKEICDSLGSTLDAKQVKKKML